MANTIVERFIPFNHTVKTTRNSEALGKKLLGDVVKIDNTRYAWPLGRKEEVYTSSYA